MEFSEPNRIFKVWEYSVTHRSLLLRSDSDLGLASKPRIEVHAGNVQVMFLRSSMKGLVIRKVSGSEADALARKYGIVEYLDYIFLLESMGGEGLIVSGNPSWAMADCPVDAPSFFSRSNEIDRYPGAAISQIA